MKKIAILLIAMPFVVAAQKEIKPSVSKAESALQKGKLDEAKSIIDATVTNQEFMVDKKGQPSKNAAKAWYLKGMIYAAIDTVKCDTDNTSITDRVTIGMTEEKVIEAIGAPKTKNRTVNASATSEQWVYGDNIYLYLENGKLTSFQDSGKKTPVTEQSKSKQLACSKIKSLDPNPFVAAKEAFIKAEEIDKGKNESLVNGINMGLQIPMLKTQVAALLGQKYLERGYTIFQKKDYKSAFVDIEKVVFFLPNDTSQLMNAGVYFAPAAEENDKALDYIKRYRKNGGKGKDAVLQEYSIYNKRADDAKKLGKEKDKQYDALHDSVYMKNINAALKVIQELSAKYPDNVDYINLEYNIYAQTNQLAEAKQLMEKRAKADPKDRESRYFLGLICNELKDVDGAKHWMGEAIKVDPDYYEANLVLGKLTYADAQKLRNDRNAISGSKPADLKKRQDLYAQIPVVLKESVVYWEKCVTINSSDEEGLYGLLSVYSDISLYDENYEPKIVELKKKMKALGMEVD